MQHSTEIEPPPLRVYVAPSPAAPTPLVQQPNFCQLHSVTDLKIDQLISLRRACALKLSASFYKRLFNKQVRFVHVQKVWIRRNVYFRNQQKFCMVKVSVEFIMMLDRWTIMSVTFKVNYTQVDRNSSEYLSQLLNDKKQLQIFPNLFIHLEKILDEGNITVYKRIRLFLRL